MYFLPHELIHLIYSFDSTYHEIFNKILKDLILYCPLKTTHLQFRLLEVFQRWDQEMNKDFNDHLCWCDPNSICRYDGSDGYSIIKFVRHANTFCRFISLRILIRMFCTITNV